MNVFIIVRGLCEMCICSMIVDRMAKELGNMKIVSFLCNEGLIYEDALIYHGGIWK